VIGLFGFYLFGLIVLLLVAVKSVVMVKPDERAVLFRLGKFVGVRPPGLNITVPFLDRVVRVRVDQINGHEIMSEQELIEKIGKNYR